MKILNGMSFGQLSAIVNVLLALLILSWCFNRYIEKAGASIEGWDWLLVAIGVTYTQMAVGLLDLLLPWNAFYLGMLAYSVSGFPMIRGAYLRHKETHARAKKALHE